MEFDKKILNHIIKVALYSCYLHPVKLNIIFTDLDIEQLLINLKDYKISYNKKIIDKLSWKTIIFKNITKLKIFTLNIGEIDDYGQGFGTYEFDPKEFKYIIKNKNGINLKNLIEGIYRMKTNKYDLYHEEFYEMKTKEKKNKIIVEVMFIYN